MSENILDILPVNFRHEKLFLKNNGFNSWKRLKFLTENDIKKILNKHTLCTESRLKKIRAIAVFVDELNLKPDQAYLLLHSGISSVKVLATQNPYDLGQKIGRLERSLNIKIKPNFNQSLLKKWIKKAEELIQI